MIATYTSPITKHTIQIEIVRQLLEEDIVITANGTRYRADEVVIIEPRDLDIIETIDKESPEMDKNRDYLVISKDKLSVSQYSLHKMIVRGTLDYLESTMIDSNLRHVPS